MLYYTKHVLFIILKRILFNSTNPATTSLQITVQLLYSYNIIFSGSERRKPARNTF